MKMGSPGKSETIRLRESDSAIEEGLLHDEPDSPDGMAKFPSPSSSSIEDNEGLEEKPEVSSS